MALCLLLATGLAYPKVENYDFPFTNRYVATVVGTPENLRDVETCRAHWERIAPLFLRLGCKQDPGEG